MFFSASHQSSDEEEALDNVLADQDKLARNLMRSAAARGANLSYSKARAAVRGVEIMKRHGFKLALPSLREMPSMLRDAARGVCAVLHEVKGIDPKHYLAELDRLDIQDALDAVARWRADRAPTIHPNQPTVLSERAWIEANGY